MSHPAVTSITIALDVDGVICPFVDPLDDLRHERATGWNYISLPGIPRAVVAEPIVQTLFDLGVASAGSDSRDEGVGGDADQPSGIRVLWHTSRWLEAPASLAPALGLDHLSGGAEKMFATRDEFLGKTDATWSSTWWKLAAVERWLSEHPISPIGQYDQLIWIDDDINDAVGSGEISAELQRDPRLVMISPSLHTAMNPDELALLRQLTNLS